MFGWFRKQKYDRQGKGGLVTVYLNPLHALLYSSEKRKGSPLTQEEVLRIRDNAVSIQMTEEQAAKFYAALDARVNVYRMNPDYIWEEWQEIRDHII